MDRRSLSINPKQTTSAFAASEDHDLFIEWQHSCNEFSGCRTEAKIPKAFVWTLMLIEKGDLLMRKSSQDSHSRVSAQPRLHQHGAEIQPFGTVRHENCFGPRRGRSPEVTERLNQLLADCITLRDIYKKYHWQAEGPTFYQLHLLFDKHFSEQLELVDVIAERIQLLGRISAGLHGAGCGRSVRVLSALHVAGKLRLVQISRLIDAHQIIVGDCPSWPRAPPRLGTSGAMTLS